VTEGPARALVAPVSYGLGDLVVSLPVVQAVLQEGPSSGRETWLVTRSDVQQALAERIGGLAGTVAERDVVVGPGDVLADLRDHPLQRDAWWGSPEFEAAHGSLSINEILRRIAADFGVDADFSSPVPLAARARSDVEELVLLVADSDGAAKRWPPERWIELARSLRQEGTEVAVVTRSPCDGVLTDRGLTGLVAPTVGDAVDVLTGCRAVIGVDTGLTHIAAQQGTPTVTLSRMPAVYFRAWDHTRLAAGTRCDPECRRVEMEYAYHQRVDLTVPPLVPRGCPVEATCLRSIEPDHVVSALFDLL
jgi:Glycosyltransferase family 9 (heptosyltransferase)